MSVVSLREIDDGNRDAVLALRVTPIQTRFVSSVAESLREAEETPEGKPWYRAVYADDLPVGFVMLSWDVTPEPPRIIGPWFLWRLLIDRAPGAWVRSRGGQACCRRCARQRCDRVADQLRPRRGRAGGVLSACRLQAHRRAAEKGEIIVALDLDAMILCRGKIGGHWLSR